MQWMMDLTCFKMTQKCETEFRQQFINGRQKESQSNQKSFKLFHYLLCLNFLRTEGCNILLRNFILNFTSSLYHVRNSCNIKLEIYMIILQIKVGMFLPPFLTLKCLISFMCLTNMLYQTQNIDHVSFICWFYNFRT